MPYVRNANSQNSPDMGCLQRSHSIYRNHLAGRVFRSQLIMEHIGTRRLNHMSGDRPVNQLVQPCCGFSRPAKRRAAGTPLWRAQAEILRAIASERRVAVKACHASGNLRHRFQQANRFTLPSYGETGIILRCGGRGNTGHVRQRTRKSAAATRPKRPERLCRVYSGYGAGSELKADCEKVVDLWRVYWRARRDSNPQPSDPKSDALSS
jgi:hypothetical protein